MALANINITTDQMLLAEIVDGMNLLLWTKTKDATKGRNKPKSLLQSLLKNQENKDEYEVFKDGKEFERMKELIIKQ